MTQQVQTATVPVECAGQRLDQVLAQLWPDYSRTRLQQWLKAGKVTVDGAVPRGKDKVWGGESIDLAVEAALEDTESTAWGPQDLPVNVVYEDAQLLIVDKEPGVVVHPGAGNRELTLVNALLHRFPELAKIPRAGIIHRLDKDTSGLLVVARSLSAHHGLVEQIQAREFEREYRSVVLGIMTAGGTVDAPIGRHPVHRTRMAVAEGGRESVTHYRVLERFRIHTYIRLNLETGRTHQIRVHMAHVDHPLVGDPTYGGRLRLPPKAAPELSEALRGFKRQALHAAALGLTHPKTGETMRWESPVPDDMVNLLARLREDVAAHGD